MNDESKSLDERFDKNFKAREKLEKKFWAASNKLNDEYDALMKELEES